jgi:glycosyltransferase involved in cell wall biosynthesis/2-polyprenyl-3-methyl-5-hydroxy-6-metoxy-1,4-benzoquinol methylase
VSRISLLLPLFQPNVKATFENWQGGRIYIENLARVLSDLPDGERPSIYVTSDEAVDLPVLRALFREAAVEGIFRPDGYPVLLKPHLMAALLDENNQPRTGEIRALLANVDVTFPVLQADVNVPYGLHWIPDFQHKYLPEMFSRDELAHRDRNFEAITQRRRFLLLSSKAAEADCKRFYPNARARTFIWSFASSLEPASAPPADWRARHGIPEKFLFAPNQFWKHKDHETLFRAFARARAARPDLALVCTGAGIDYRNPELYGALRAFITANGLEGSVHFLGVVGNDVLVQLFQHAAAVVQPSRFEGWSTVVEDAKALGRPLFVSDLPVHREQADSAVSPFHFFRTGDVDDLAAKLSAAWPDLRPGPDPAAAQKGQEQRRARAAESARAFMAIAAEIRAQKSAAPAFEDTLDLRGLNILRLEENAARHEAVIVAQQDDASPATQLLLESTYLDKDRAGAFERFCSGLEFQAMRRLFEIFGVQPGQRVCEVGGGAGFLSWALVQAGFKDVTLVEPNSEYNTGTGYLRTRADAAGLHIHNDLHTWHAGEGSYDLILTKNCIHHFKNITQAAAAIRQKMRPGARWFAFREQFADTARELYELLAAHPYCQQYGLYEWAYPASHYVEAIALAGFKLSAVLPAGYANHALAAYRNDAGDAEARHLTAQVDELLQKGTHGTVTAFWNEVARNRSGNGAAMRFFSRPPLMVFELQAV